MSVFSQAQIDNMILSGKILTKAMRAVIKSIKPGMSAEALDEIAEMEIRREGGKPSFKNYGDGPGKPFPAALCVSFNSEVVHGMPSPNKIIKEGDLVSLDLGCVYNGMYTDMAETVGVGKIKPLEQKLLQVTKEALRLGISSAKVGGHIGDIGYEIEKFVLSAGFSVVKDLVGHGVGLAIHDDPQIPNFGRFGSGDLILEHTGLAIEPMVNMGSHQVLFDKDGWTVKTFDGQKSAHFEQTIITAKGKPIIVTPF